MKNHLFGALIVLLIAILACSNRNNPPQAEGSAYTSINSVAVNPPSGNESFTLQVDFEADFLPPKVYPLLIYCNYVTPEGATRLIGSIDPMQFHSQKSGREKATARLDFSVRQADGKIIAGRYLAGCSTGQSAPVGAAFTVVEEPTPTPEKAPQPAPTAILPAPTVAPSLPPTPAPVTVSGAGRQIYTDGHSNNLNCAIPAAFSLTILSDGSAEISITSRDINYVTSADNTECFWRPTEYTFTVASQADRTSQTVVFRRAENARMCDGTFSYANGVLSGSFLCSSGFASYEFGNKYEIP